MAGSVCLTSIQPLRYFFKILVIFLNPFRLIRMFPGQIWWSEHRDLCINESKGAFCLECTYFLDIAKLRYTIFFIFWNNLKNDREGVSECQNMKVKHPAVILRPSLQRLDKYKSSIAQPISREVTFFSSIS